jgi:hypothetical protein
MRRYLLYRAVVDCISTPRIGQVYQERLIVFQIRLGIYTLMYDIYLMRLEICLHKQRQHRKGSV